MATLSAKDTRSARAGPTAIGRFMAGRSAAAWGALLTFVAVFLLGGSSRADVAPLLILRPLSALFLVWALWAITADDIRANRRILSVAVAIFALVALSLVPLPPGIWQALPGREIIAQIDSALGVTGAWHPFTMTPDATFNSLLGLVVPLAMVVFMVQLDSREKTRLAIPVAILLGLSGAIEYLQAFGLPFAPYHVSNPNSGLFANRNHQSLALACLIPLLTVLSVGRAHRKPSGRRRRRRAEADMAVFLAAGGVVLILPLIFIAGSRAGLVLAALGVLAAVGIAQIADPGTRSGRRDWKVRAGQLAVGLSLFAFAIWAVAGSDRNLAGSRLFGKNVAEDDRFEIWEQTINLAMNYFPFGSGIGSFVEVYQIGEPADLLQAAYINHAHNDFIELFLTTGIAGVAFVGLLAFAFGKALFRTVTDRSLDSDTKRYRWAGSAIIVLCVLASVVDYPLRTPALGCLFVYAVFLAGLGPHSIAGRTMPDRGHSETVNA